MSKITPEKITEELKKAGIPDGHLDEAISMVENCLNAANWNLEKSIQWTAKIIELAGSADES